MKFMAQFQQNKGASRFLRFWTSEAMSSLL